MPVFGRSPKSKHGAKGSAQRMPRDSQIIVLEFGFVKKTLPAACAWFLPPCSRCLRSLRAWFLRTALILFEGVYPGNSNSVMLIWTLVAQSMTLTLPRKTTAILFSLGVATIAQTASLRRPALEKLSRINEEVAKPSSIWWMRVSLPAPLSSDPQYSFGSIRIHQRPAGIADR